MPRRAFEVAYTNGQYRRQHMICSERALRGVKLQIKTFGLTFIGVLSVLLFVAACSDSKPEPMSTAVLSTSTPEPTAAPKANLTLNDVKKAVDEALKDGPEGVTAVDVKRIIDRTFPSGPGVDTAALEKMIEEELIPAREALLALNPEGDDENDNETSTPDVLFRYMNAVNTLYAGQNDEAIPAFDLIIRVHPDLGRAYYYRGIAFYRAGFDEEAMADFDKSIELDPDFGETYHARGLLYYDLGDRQAAMGDFNQAIDIAPWLADVFRNRGALNLNNGLTGPGLADLERAREIYALERRRERFDEVQAILNEPPNEPLQMFTSTDILPRLP